MKIAVFISPHGFGHAARALAVMEALEGPFFHLFTTVPPVFFEGELADRIRVHPVECDVGLRQRSALEMDLPATVVALDAFRDRVRELAPELGSRISALGCSAVLCDISPLGIAAAREAGVPSILMENFTWDWIYEPLAAEEPGLVRHGAWLADLFGQATRRHQVEPVCRRALGAPVAPPVARPPRRSREDVRRELGIGDDERAVLVTMGGLGHDLPFLERLGEAPARFLVTALEADAVKKGGRVPGNVVPFRRDEPAYLPDLIAASDLVVAKLGYSTVAEVWLQNRPLLYVANRRFREVGVLRDFVERELPAGEMRQADFDSGRWLEEGAWMEMAGAATHPGPPRRSGAAEVAEALLQLLGAQPAEVAT